MSDDRYHIGGRGSHRSRRTISAVLALLLALGLLVTMSGVGLAARQRVRAGDDVWMPNHLFITEGDTVVWRNPGDLRHDVVAYGGGWRFNRTLDPGDVARRVFDRAREDPFLFRCTLHSRMRHGICEGMCGLIHVFVA